MRHLAYIVICLILASCRPSDTATFAYQPTPVDGWEVTDSLCFPIDSIVQSGEYTLSIGVRTSSAHPYPYRDIAFQVVERIGGRKTRRLNTTCHLTDSAGDVSGKGISTYQYAFDVDRIHLTEGDTGTIIIRHHMRDPILPGITDVGVKVSRD